MSLIGKAVKYGLVAKLASYAYEQYNKKQNPVSYAAKRTWFGKPKPVETAYGFNDAASDLMNIVQKLRRG